MNDLPLADAWRTLAHLLGRLRSSGHRSDWLVETLDLLVEQLEADRGLVLVRDPGADRVVEARDRRGSLPQHERWAVSQSVIQRAIEDGRPCYWELGDEGATESLASFGIIAAVALPLLQAGSDQAFGALYLDFRRPRWVLGTAGRALLESVADAVAIVLGRDRRLDESTAQLADAQTNASGLTLKELLAPSSMASVRVELAALGDELPVLITGEPGTGKTLLCRALAEASTRRPIVRATLGASDDLNTITSELFGHERGAFSGASGRRVGLVEQAREGTLVLDEVLSLPAHAQALLLDLTQFGTYRPLGYAGRDPKHADLRILAATNGDLEAAVREGRFRADLLHRLAGVRVELPPLRARRGEIVGLSQGMLRRLDPARSWTLSVEARRWLGDEGHPWHGNLRELSMLIRRARARALGEDAEAERLELAHLAPRSPRTPVNTPAPLEAPSARLGYERLKSRHVELEEEERQLLNALMETYHHNVSRVARELGLPRTSLIARMQSLGVRRASRATAAEESSPP